MNGRAATALVLLRDIVTGLTPWQHVGGRGGDEWGADLTNQAWLI